MVRQFGWIYLEGFKLCIISPLNGDGDDRVFSMNGFSSEFFLLLRVWLLLVLRQQQQQQLQQQIKVFSWNNLNAIL